MILLLGIAWRVMLNGVFEVKHPYNAGYWVNKRRRDSSEDLRMTGLGVWVNGNAHGVTSLVYGLIEQKYAERPRG